ncbi:MAG: alpha/beta hydrolase-fold protein [Pirellulaceae bacterium]
MIPCILAVILVAVAEAAEPVAVVSAGRLDQDGFLVHTVNSPFQAGRTEIRVLLPDHTEPGQRYSVVYVLPVEAGNENVYGSGLLEVKRRDLHNKHRAVFVAPTFSQLPWYADHPTNLPQRMETHFLKVVVPFVEGQYPVQAESDGKLLLGFSKSGWGAFSLLLRHPQVFGRAAAWDAPLMKDKPDQFGMGEMFGTQQNFEKYQISRLLQERASELRGDKRLILTGYGNFRQHHQQTHEQMVKLGVPHEYRDGPERKHDWHSGWVAEAVELLMQTQSGDQQGVSGP